jgi:hypothetical protein
MEYDVLTKTLFLSEREADRLGFALWEPKRATGKMEWWTPPSLFESLGLEFDLDPCSPAGGLEWVPARQYYALPQDGLTLPWHGKVWLNPPYNRPGPWTDKLNAHGNGVALVANGTDTQWFQRAATHADSVCFIAGRLAFVHSETGDDTKAADFGSILLGYGDCAEAVANCGLGFIRISA